MKVALHTLLIHVGWMENEESLRSRVLMAQSVKYQKVEYGSGYAEKGKKNDENSLLLSKETTLFSKNLASALSELCIHSTHFPYSGNPTFSVPPNRTGIMDII